MNVRSALADIAAGLDAYAERARRQWDLPALALAITDETGAITRFAGAGSVAVGEHRPPTPRTGWRVASITKTLTATAIFQLRDRGLLDLDDPLARHIPEFAAARPTAGPLEGVTLRRMLTHRSGLTTEPPLPSWSSLRFPDMAEILAALGTAEVAVEPGSRFKYSNFAFGLLGEVVARRSGMPYAAYVQRELFGPLGMADSTFEPDGRDAAARVADSHVVSRPLGGAHRPAPYVALAGLTAAGQLITTAADLARWTAAQFRGGPAPHVLDDASLAEMQAVTDAVAGPDNVRTLGWELTTDLGGPVHGHGGGLFGFGSYLAFHAPSRTGVIALTNLWPSRGAAGHIAAELFGQMLGGTRPKPEAAVVPDPDGSAAPEGCARSSDRGSRSRASRCASSGAPVGRGSSPATRASTRCTRRRRSPSRRPTRCGRSRGAPPASCCGSVARGPTAGSVSRSAASSTNASEPAARLFARGAVGGMARHTRPTSGRRHGGVA